MTILEGALYHKDEAESRLGDAYTPVRRDEEDFRNTAEQTFPDNNVLTVVDETE